MDPQWFEMNDFKEGQYARKTWVPLRATMYPVAQGCFPEVGHLEEFFALGSVAFPIRNRKAAENLAWEDIGLNGHGPIIEGQRYVPSGEWEGFSEQPRGLALVLDQSLNGEEPSIWHLHQDLVFALKLKREGDVWVCPSEGYDAAARIKHQENGSPELIEIRSDFLRDYLCAREMGLYLTSYRARRAVIEDLAGFPCKEGIRQETIVGGRWMGAVSPITKDGSPYGSAVAVIHIARTDAHRDEDIPELSGPPTDDNTASSSASFKRLGPKRYLLTGELWKNEWIDPAPSSPRVRDDKVPTPCYYLTDCAGGRSSSDELADGGKWIWFKAEVIFHLINRRGGGLIWSTREIGRVYCSPGFDVVFGVNQIGLVVVYAKDIARLPAWQQQIWAARNTHPDGGLPIELFRAQVEGHPSDTIAPEARLQRTLEHLLKTFKAATGEALFLEHPDRPRILSLAHRFRAHSPEGLLALAKDLARLTGDSFDRAALNRLVPSPKCEPWGSIKSLEKVLATVMPPEKARGLMTPLVGVWELRHADAHLPGSNPFENLWMVDVDPEIPLVWQGARLIESCAEALEKVAEQMPTLAAHFKR